MTFLEILKVIQDRHGLSSGAMADAFGMSRQGYRQMLLRDGRPSFFALQSFLAAVPVDANFLLMGSGEVDRESDSDRISRLEARLDSIEAILKPQQP